MIERRLREILELRQAVDAGHSGNSPKGVRKTNNEKRGLGSLAPGAGEKYQFGKKPPKPKPRQRKSGGSKSIPAVSLAVPTMLQKRNTPAIIPSPPSVERRPRRGARPMGVLHSIRCG